MQKPVTLEELKLLISSKLDVSDFMDIIGYSLIDLLENMHSEITENFDELLRACD